MSIYIVFAVISFLIIVGILVYTLICVDKQDKKLNDVTKQCELDNLIQIPSKSNISIVILAAVRNAMSGLPFFLSNVARIKKVFPNTRVVFLENDSNDNTRSYIETEFPPVLETLIINPDFIIDKDATHMAGSGKKRILRMAKLRNQLLTHIKDTDNYVMMCDPDWDICISILDFTKAIQYLEENNQVAAVVPMLRNRPFYFPFINYYFDTFAFQSEEFPEPSSNNKEYFGLQYKKWKENDVINVESAFGSFAIYRQEDIKGIEYSVLDSKISGKCRCEHVGFHKSLREKTKKQIRLLTWFKIIA